MEKPSVQKTQEVPAETQDKDLAARFWERNQKPEVRTTMMNNIETAVSLGDLNIFTRGNPEEDAQEMAAYRRLALEEKGYMVGPFKERPGGAIATARIEGRRKD